MTAVPEATWHTNGIMDLKSHTVPYNRKDGGSYEFEVAFIWDHSINLLSSYEKIWWSLKCIGKRPTMPHAGLCMFTL